MLSINTRKAYSCLYLRNMVLGYECGRVFPAAVGSGSPSRDTANWMSSRFSRTVETRRRYGWLRIVFPRCAPFSSSNTVPFGRWLHARGRGHYRGKPGLLVSAHHIRRGRRASRSSTGQWSAEPLCVRTKGANRGVSEGKKSGI